MPDHEPVSHAHYGYPGMQFSPTTHDKSVTESLSREAGERDLALIRALNPPPWETQAQAKVRTPILAENFSEECAQLDREIFERGVPVDKTKLLELGKQRFTRLLETDRAARSSQRIIGTRIDLTRFDSVQFAFANVGAFAAAIPRRRNAEVLSGQGADREAAAQILSFDDLWKITSEPVVVRDVFAFRDEFESLIFARSLLARLGEDDRARSRFFTGGSGRRVDLFSSWLSVLRQPPLVSIALVDPLTSIFSWLSGERLSAPTTHDFFSERLTSQHQRRFTEALWHGFLLGHDGWSLWAYVGQRTRVAADHTQLVNWRNELSKRFRAIESFHTQLSANFYKHIGDHREFDSKRHRLFLDQIVSDCLNSISALIAIALADAKPVARFQNVIFTEQLPNSRAKIHATLAAAFPQAVFQIEVNEQ